MCFTKYTSRIKMYHTIEYCFLKFFFLCALRASTRSRYSIDTQRRMLPFAQLDSYVQSQSEIESRQLVPLALVNRITGISAGARLQASRAQPRVITVVRNYLFDCCIQHTLPYVAPLLYVCSSQKTSDKINSVSRSYSSRGSFATGP